MKLFCFLLTFVLVSASADEEADCLKQVFLANTAIKNAYNLTVDGNPRENGLERVIEKLVNFTAHLRRSFAKISYMIAMPDKTEIFKDIPEYETLSPMKKCIHYQYNIQRAIINILNIVMPQDEGQDFGGSTLETLANERREYVVQALRNMLKRELGPMYDNFMSELELKIRDSIIQDLGIGFEKLSLPNRYCTDYIKS
ncbi:uncharacterized protein LOC126837905 [Adelges cooleyi]|uniref:uncharacterized protein LOC126837905 n=1 Tax=Adelges cooleyi TaxID=133065 RepID=UPI002180442A|nr:uncharacterized protein LOC126837905 [Adelges cooleyi]